MTETNRNRETVIAIGLNDYDYLTKLNGTNNDVDRLENLLCNNTATALMCQDQFSKYFDVTSSELRSILNEYILNRTAANDILIFYFSGHAVPIGENDLGLCTKDTSTFVNGAEAPISLNLVKFSDIVESLAVAKVDPVFIIDACYSGQAGEVVSQVYGKISERTQQAVGTSYALLCACTKFEEAMDEKNGGIFSRLLENVAQKGINSGKYKGVRNLTIQDLFPMLKHKAEQAYEMTPKLFLGATPFSCEIVKNVQYQPRTETLRPHFKTLKAFWNNGDHLELNTADLSKIGRTEHTTYSKLEYGPAWSLIEKPKRGTGRLTERGIAFMQGELQVADIIERNEKTGEWHAADGSQLVYLNDLEPKKPT